MSTWSSFQRTTSEKVRVLHQDAPLLGAAWSGLDAMTENMDAFWLKYLQNWGLKRLDHIDMDISICTGYM